MDHLGLQVGSHQTVLHMQQEGNQQVLQYFHKNLAFGEGSHLHVVQGHHHSQELHRMTEGGRGGHPMGDKQCGKEQMRHILVVHHKDHCLEGSLMSHIDPSPSLAWHIGRHEVHCNLVVHHKDHCLVGSPMSQSDPSPS